MNKKGVTKTKKNVIKSKKSWRDLSVTKKCKVCGKVYHPRKKNNYYISKYCSTICSRKGSAANLKKFASW